MPNPGNWTSFVCCLYWNEVLTSTSPVKERVALSNSNQFLYEKVCFPSAPVCCLHANSALLKHAVLSPLTQINLDFLSLNHIKTGKWFIHLDCIVPETETSTNTIISQCKICTCCNYTVQLLISCSSSSFYLFCLLYLGQCAAIYENH